MNSYNENLHSSVVASLQSQQDDVKKVTSEANASMFTLYHAQGALKTAADKFEDVLNQLKNDARTKIETVRNSNLSNNLLASATQAGQYLQQSVSNAAVAASNVQIAATATVKLASDIGSIYSIVHAADFDTGIHHLAKEVRHYMNETAYNAELASQLAMEASVLTSSISGSTVLDKAKSNNNSMNNLLKVVSAAFDSTSQLVASENVNLAAVNVKEKSAEGAYQDLSADKKASGAAYTTANDKLNLGLTAWTVKYEESSTFGVRFKPLKPTFEEEAVREKTYPAKEYYLFVVKDKQKSTFSLSNADAILNDTTQKERYIRLSVMQHINEETGEFENEFDYKEIPDDDGTEYMLNDTDGDPVETGTAYVVFIVAVLDDEYKKHLNNYDDFISAPSSDFTLVNQLAAARSIKYTKTVIDNPTDGSAPNNDQSSADKITVPAISFTVKENPDFEVEYRCVLLPASNPLGKDSLNAASIQEKLDEIAKLEKINDEFDPTITALQASMIETRNKIQEMTGGRSKAGAISSELAKLLQLYRQNKKELKTKLKERDAAIEAINENSTSRIDFIFNLDIAEELSAGNYVVAVKAHSSAQHDTDKRKKSHPLPAAHTENWLAPIAEGTTDNFGNVLEKGSVYVPVILSVSKAKENNLSRFADAWTGYDRSPLITI